MLKKTGGIGLKRCAGVLCAFFLIFSALFIHASANAAGTASANNSATKIDIYCTVNADGACLVSMTANLHLESSSVGLSFPLPVNAENIKLNGSSTSTTRSGTRTLVDVGRATGGMTGDFPLRFDFTLPKAVSVTADKKLQLTLPMLSGFDYPVESFSFIITLPDDITSVPLFTSTYQQVGFEADLDLVTNGNMITGSSKSSLNDHESVTMTLTVPREMFPTVSIYQRTGNPEVIPMAIFAGLALVYWLLFLFTLPPVRERSTVPPEGVSAGEVNCRVTMTGADLTMMVLSWAQMGYVMLQLDGSKVYIFKQMEMGNERSLFEIRMFQTLFQNRRAVCCTSRGYANLCKKAASMIPGEKAMCRPGKGSRKVFRVLLCISQVFCGICVAMNMTSIPVLQILFSVIFGVMSAVSAWVLHEYALHLLTRDKWPGYAAIGICVLWFLLGLIAGQPWIPLISVVLQVLFGFLAAFGGKRTALNRGEAGEILALRRYLRHMPREEAKRLNRSDPEFFFRMAPYAIALGVGKPFAAAFARRPMENCPYLLTRKEERRTAEQWMRLLTQTADLMDSRYRRTQTERWMAVRIRLQKQ